MIKTLLITSGVALTALFSYAALSHSNVAATNVNTQQTTKWQLEKTDYKVDNAPDKTKQNQKEKLLTIVGKYAPETLNQWKQAISIRNDLVSQLSSDEVKQLRKENRQALKKELKAEMKSGKLTKKEAIQQIKERFKQNKENKQQAVNARKEWRKEIKAAIQRNDTNTIKSLLEKFYQQFDAKNKVLSKRLNTWKTKSTSDNSNNNQNSL
ncbi:MAG: hypothetical protein ACO1OT_08820 [Heyndrickxia sp.]